MTSTYHAERVPLGHDRYDERWAIVDNETGEVLDDAQGYGYKNAEKAYAAYAYKSLPGFSPAREKAMKKTVKTWASKHKDFCDYLSDCLFYAAKDHEHVTNKQISKIFADHGYHDLPFTTAEFLRFW